MKFKQDCMEINSLQVCLEVVFDMDEEFVTSLAIGLWGLRVVVPSLASES